LQQADFGSKIYMNFQDYPDTEMVALLTAASAHTGTPADGLLEDFGTFIAPDLLAMYRGLIPTTWRTLDVLENTEGVIHRVVRLRNAGAQPPRLQSSRPTPAQVQIRYDSPRRLCALAKGICWGIAQHYNETIRISEPQCMPHGAAACLLVVQLAEVDTALAYLRR
jgi:hypothetical protein